jgi:putative copper export protein
VFAAMLALHVLGATVWTGGHLVLALTVLPRALRARDPETVRQFEEGYERIGIPALATQVVTGVWLAHHMLPDLTAWLDLSSVTAVHIVLKLVLLLCTVGLAVHARLRLVPRLSAETLPVLAWHIVAVTVLSVAFVFVGIGIRTGGLF